ncbi:centrosomal protein of 19 kDa-like [Penaeus monodon]|uniref:centrosomal protein of 19 kDa-like n=1 Tax=Penaeus monodon TaxID=6687 RepID=UPI0018A727E8|nr:centrosomal protein of 19 kDa-like [Penaeus monodon]
MEARIEPQKLGIRAQPPALILIYRNSDGRERQRTMPIRFLNKYGTVEKVLKELKERHKETFGKDSHYQSLVIVWLDLCNDKDWQVFGACGFDVSIGVKTLVAQRFLTCAFIEIPLYMTSRSRSENGEDAEDFTGIQKGRSIDEAVSNISKDYDLDPNQDLNKLNDEQLNRKKKIMDNTFQKNQLKPGDPGYEYDKQVDFDTAEKVEAGWDSFEEDFWS